ncbi:hypothetical protein SAMN05216302_106811, partial [Nitrosomonas aestuarii]
PESTMISSHHRNSKKDIAPRLGPEPGARGLTVREPGVICTSALSTRKRCGYGAIML